LAAAIISSICVDLGEALRVVALQAGQQVGCRRPSRTASSCAL
jgi:hypothetical protein